MKRFAALSVEITGLTNMAHREIKSLIADSSLNLIAFGMYIALQQIVIMPVLSVRTGTEIFAGTVLFITVLNIVNAVLGEELGNTKLVLNARDEGRGTGGNYGFLLTLILPVSAAVSAAACLLIGLSAADAILFTAAAAFGSARWYSMASFRLGQNFKKVVWQTLFYSAGSAGGLALFFCLDCVALPFLLGEGAALLYAMYDGKWRIPERRRTERFGAVLHTFFHLSGISLLNNLLSYFDRFIVYPLMGPLVMAVYFSASSMSKIIALAVNPVNGVLLARLAILQDTARERVRKAVLISILPMTVLFLLGSMLLTTAGTRLLYPAYYEQAKELLLPVCMASAFSCATSVIKPVLMRFTSTRAVFMIYLIFTVLFAGLGILMGLRFGIVGFAVAGSIARFAQLSLFTALLLKLSGKNRMDDQNECCG